MTPHEILQELRPIHLPPVDAPPTAFVLSPWPFVVLAAVIGVIIVLRFWRVTAWRRQAQARLAQIAAIDDQAAQCSALLDLLQAVPVPVRVAGLPPAAFVPPDRRDAAAAEILRAHVEHLLSHHGPKP